MRDELRRLTVGSMVLLGIMVMQAWFGSRTAIADDLPLTGLKIRVETPFYKECRAFYTEHLGMKVFDSWDESGDKGVILGLGSSAQGEAYLEIAYVETRKSYKGISLQLRIRNRDAITEKLRGRLEFRGPKERPWGGRYLYLKDPTGIQVILYESEL